MYPELLSAIIGNMSGLIEIKSTHCKLSLNLLDGTSGSNLRRTNKLGTEGLEEGRGQSSMKELDLMHGDVVFDPLLWLC